ncbi:UNVERIFIED_CONTAM: hypothetical protein K2H54_042115 [Gekko kuhli]
MFRNTLRKSFTLYPLLLHCHFCHSFVSIALGPPPFSTCILLPLGTTRGQNTLGEKNPKAIGTKSDKNDSVEVESAFLQVHTGPKRVTVNIVTKPFQVSSQVREAKQNLLIIFHKPFSQEQQLCDSSACFTKNVHLIGQNNPCD